MMGGACPRSPRRWILCSRPGGVTFEADRIVATCVPDCAARAERSGGESTFLSLTRAPQRGRDAGLAVGKHPAALLRAFSFAAREGLVSRRSYRPPRRRRCGPDVGAIRGQASVPVRSRRRAAHAGRPPERHLPDRLSRRTAGRGRRPGDERPGTMQAGTMRPGRCGRGDEKAPSRPAAKALVLLSPTATCCRTTSASWMNRSSA